MYLTAADSGTKEKLILPILKNFLYGTFGLILGTTVNQMSRWIGNKINRHYPVHKVFKIFLQMVLCSVAISRVYMFFPHFGDSWQSTIPGLFFAGFFFNTQDEMFDLIRSLQNARPLKR